MTNGRTIQLKDVHDELRTSNRLAILALVQRGVQQSDIAAAIGVSKSVVSEMFPKGLLRRVSQGRSE